MPGSATRGKMQIIFILQKGNAKKYITVVKIKLAYFAGGKTDLPSKWTIAV
jgi:hypothetical protein